MTKRWQLWAAVGLWLAAFGWMAFNAQAQSPTMDEQNHIARGYVFLRTGDPRLSVEHPPLINSLEALPLLMLPDVQIPTDDWAWEAGEWYRFSDLFLWYQNHDVDRMIYLARLPVIALTLLLSAMATRWANVWGKSCALLTLALITLDPNILAHGGLATTDMGQTLAVFITGYAMWSIAQRDRLHHSQRGAIYPVVLAGLAMGAMLASKISALAFVGVFGALMVGDAVVAVAHRQSPLYHRYSFIARRVLVMVMMTLMALAVLWGVYAFQIAPATEGGPPLPMGTYWKGVLSIFEQTQGGGRPSYLLGKTSVHGWWTYFPIAFAVKTPLPALILLALAIPASMLLKRCSVCIFLLAPALAYSAMITQSALNIGYRHMLPALPFLYVWAGQLANIKYPIPNTKIPLSALYPLLLCWLALETSFIAPHFISYFNQLGGGPANGWKIVADSNIDWGQDLKALRDYVRDNQLGKIKLSWFGSSYPGMYGIEYEPLPGLPHHFELWADPPFDPQHPAPGVYAISVSNLVETQFEDKRVFGYFRARAPDARIGYSIYVYKVTR